MWSVKQRLNGGIRLTRVECRNKRQKQFQTRNLVKHKAMSSTVPDVVWKDQTKKRQLKRWKVLKHLAISLPHFCWRTLLFYPSLWTVAMLGHNLQEWLAKGINPNTYSFKPGNQSFYQSHLQNQSNRDVNKPTPLKWW